MNTQKKLSLLVILLVGIIVIFLGLGAWTLTKLPGAYEIKKAFTPAVLQPVASEAPTQATHEEHIKEDLIKIITQDFTNRQKPLVDACRYIEQAPSSRVFINNPDASAQEFQEALVSGKKDPVAESIAPVLRYLFRAPRVPLIIRQIDNADTIDMSLVSKTELYAHIYQALSFLADHEQEINLLIQKSYYLNTLMRAVALNPPLAQDATVLTMCHHLEQSILGKEGFNSDKEVDDLSHLLQQNNITPQSIGFDSTYRSQIVTDFSGASFSLNEPWLSKIFAKDLEKLKHRHRL